jgi:hypothetical protein
MAAAQDSIVNPSQVTQLFINSLLENCVVAERLPPAIPE